MTFGLILIGCEPRILAGEVVKKEHKEEEITITYMPIVTYNGNNARTTMVPMIITHPETWKITIRAFNELENKYVYEDFYVEKNVFDSVEVGDYFEFDSNMGITERPQVKREATDKEIEMYEEQENPVSH